MNKIKKKISIIICIIFLSNVSLPIVYGADTLSKYEQELEAVKKEQQENASKLTGVERELALYAYDVAEIDSEVLSYTNNLANLQQNIKEVSTTLEDLDNKLKTANENYGILNSTYANRLRTIYENGQLVFEVIYRKIPSDIPDTGDINIVSIAIIFIFSIYTIFRKINIKQI